MLESAKIIEQIKQSNNTLIICHRNPDADTLGSAGALAFYITENLKSKAVIACIDPLPKNLSFLPISSFFINLNQLELTDFDLIIAVDCGDTTQTGVTEKYLAIKNKIPTINIDHHQTNPNYADINCVFPSGATAELIYKIFKTTNIKLNKKISTCLLTGIITDTMYFTNAGTTKESMSIASELLKSGADSKLIIQKTWRNSSPEALKIWGKVLAQLKFNPKHKIVTAVISKEDSILPEVFEGLANFLTTLYEANIILVIREAENNILKCSLRTTKDHVDVSLLAQRFGGGGHAKAAGFSLVGNLQQTQNSWKII